MSTLFYDVTTEYDEPIKQGRKSIPAERMTRKSGKRAEVIVAGKSYRVVNYTCRYVLLTDKVDVVPYLDVMEQQTPMSPAWLNWVTLLAIATSASLRKQFTGIGRFTNAVRLAVAVWMGSGDEWVRVGALATKSRYPSRRLVRLEQLYGILLKFTTA